jgi:hypothetical protein
MTVGHWWTLVFQEKLPEEWKPFKGRQVMKLRLNDVFEMADTIGMNAAALTDMIIERRCRKCGCTEDDCSQCIKKTGFACTWVEQDLCSACVPKEKSKILPRVSKVLTLVIFMILFSSCGELRWEIDPRLKDAVDLFYNEGAKRGMIFPRMGLIAKFGDLGTENGNIVLGRAIRGPGQRMITITPVGWDDQHKTELEWVVLHELGHAWLNRNHTDGKSIMNPMVWGVGWYITDPETMLDELFGRKVRTE